MKIPNWPLPSEMNKINLGLERIQKLLDILGNPEKKLPPIFHVAGTNGKGSTTSFIKYILEDADYKIHRYTSPHLVEFNERIEVSGQKITDEYYNELAEECKFVIEKNNLDVSYFEIITTIAFMAFARNEADAVILEVGMGGRLDATNVVKNPLVSVITPISLDHVNVLGDTVEKIAMEKFGIVKEKQKVIISKQTKNVADLLYENSKNMNCPTFLYNKDWKYIKIEDNKCIFKGFSREILTSLPSLEGNHQIINAGTAVAALLCQDVIKISDKNIQNGIKNTKWPARLQIITNKIYKDLINENDEFYIDGGHNEDGARVIKTWLEEKNNEQKKHNVLIVGMLNKKDVKTFAKIIEPVFEDILIVSNKKEDYISADEFERVFNDLGRKVVAKCKNIKDALSIVKNIKTTSNKRILACGSLYFCGEMLDI